MKETSSFLSSMCLCTVGEYLSNVQMSKIYNFSHATGEIGSRQLVNQSSVVKEADTVKLPALMLHVEAAETGCTKPFLKAKMRALMLHDDVVLPTKSGRVAQVSSSVT